MNYTKELEDAAKNMILIHEPPTLIKMILRMLMQKIKVAHASVLLYDKDKDIYILAISRGSLGLKVPIGMARIDKDDPLIYLFRKYKKKLAIKHGVLVYKEAKKLLKNNKVKAGPKQILNQALRQMEVFEAEAAIPSYYGDKLMGLLLLSKKNNNGGFIQDELNFLIAIASNMAMALRNAELFKELEAELGRKQQLFMRIIIALAVAIEAKDYRTHGHTTRVTNLSLDIAKRLRQKNSRGYDDKFLESLHIASLLHDIGKIGIPEYILNKEGLLTDEERKKIQEHPLIGARILQPIKELHSSILGVKYHHERYDGLGYPEGLKKDQIPSIASIISVADTFDALTTDRPYRSRLPKDRAMEEIRRLSGTQLNPQVVNTFFEIYNSKK